MNPISSTGFEQLGAFEAVEVESDDARTIWADSVKKKRKKKMNKHNVLVVLSDFSELVVDALMSVETLMHLSMFKGLTTTCQHTVQWNITFNRSSIQSPVIGWTVLREDKQSTRWSNVLASILRWWNLLFSLHSLYSLMSIHPSSVTCISMVGSAMRQLKVGKIHQRLTSRLKMRAPNSPHLNMVGFALLFPLVSTSGLKSSQSEIRLVIIGVFVS
ncbi:uncharacterized protein LOC110751516 [Prunus avium]|uniref:Uncharacterized protein LOC110751516 n=1 Tax=Prunus avium TaxID=42229 RepID=A0A6P5S175_PRUAV|nr:uncharacterized protein LOC110751516 [Prunus avium]